MLEIEIKFRVGDLAAVREQLLVAGAVLHIPRLYERNVVYDTADFALRDAQKLLRLRQDEQVRLTVKAPAPTADALSQAKVREEREISVSDFDTAEAILLHLGFEPKLVYEKYRETFHLNGLEIVLDELPYGHFVELEGDEAAMRPTADLLGLVWEERLLTNYLALMAHLKETHHLPFTDITFANFAAVTHNLW